ncbi:MAG: DUF1499 domain-containing protein [Pseudomonadota bacterium]
MSGPAFFVPYLLSLPAINDVTTDISAPPTFEFLAEQREIGANSVIYPKETYAPKQQTSYPDLQPLILDRSTKEAYDLLQETVKNLGWQMVAKQAPGKDGAAGWIEATDTTLLIGFTDDIVVRVAGDDATARIDMRSASRYGRHDLGRNASRIRELFREVKTSLALGERAIKLKEEIKRHQALKLREAERKRQEKVRLAGQQAEAFEKILQERRQQLNPVVERNSEAFKKPKKRKRRRVRRRRNFDIDDWSGPIN